MNSTDQKNHQRKVYFGLKEREVDVAKPVANLALNLSNYHSGFIDQSKSITPAENLGWC